MTYPFYESYERQSHLDRIKRLEAHVEALEDKIDPDRKTPLILEAQAFPMSITTSCAPQGVLRSDAVVRTEFGDLTLKLSGKQAEWLFHRGHLRAWSVKIEFTQILK